MPASSYAAPHALTNPRPILDGHDPTTHTTTGIRGRQPNRHQAFVDAGTASEQGRRIRIRAIQVGPDPADDASLQPVWLQTIRR